MAPIIRMPTTDQLPPGPRRAFVEELFQLYRAARRPQLRKISQLISDNHSLAGTASKETIRRMLHGETVPANWETVEAVLEALCELADKDPDSEAPWWEDSFGAGPTFREVLTGAWNAALEAPSPSEAPAPPPRNGFSDEPPF